MTKFKVLQVAASKSRTGGSNIRCQEIVMDAIFGTCQGREFVIQSETTPDEAIVNTEMERNLRFEPVEYSFTNSEGAKVDVKYTRAIPC